MFNLQKLIQEFFNFPVNIKPEIKSVIKTIEKNLNLKISSSKENAFHCPNSDGHSDGIDGNPSMIFYKNKCKCMVCNTVMYNSYDVILIILWTLYRKYKKININNEKFRFNNLLKVEFNERFNISKKAYDFIKKLDKIINLEEIFKESEELFDKTKDNYKLLLNLRKNEKLKEISKEISISLFNEDVTKIKHEYISPEIIKINNLKQYIEIDKKKEEYLKEIFRKYEKYMSNKRKIEIFKKIYNDFFDIYWQIWEINDSKINNIISFLKEKNYDEKKIKEIINIIKDYKLFNNQKKDKIFNIIKDRNNFKEIMKIIQKKETKELIEYFKKRGFTDEKRLKKLLYNKKIFYFNPKYKKELINQILFRNKFYNLKNNSDITNEDLIYFVPSFNEFKNMLKYEFKLRKNIEEKDYSLFLSKIINSESPLKEKIKIGKKEIEILDIYNFHFLSLANIYRNSKFSFENHNIIYPFFDEYGNIIHIEGRTPKNVKTKAERFNVAGPKTVYNLNEINNMEEPIIIVEGQTDALTLNYLGYNAISFPGVNTPLKEELLLKLFGKKVIILGDNDEPGLQFIDKLKNLLKDKAFLVNNDIPAFFIKSDDKEIKDINDYLKIKGEEETKKFIDNIIKELNLNLENNKNIKNNWIDNIDYSLPLTPTTTNFALGINDNNNLIKDYNLLNKKYNIKRIINNKNIIYFSINEEIFNEEYNDFIKFAKENNKKMILSRKFKFLDSYITVFFKDLNEFKKYLKITNLLLDDNFKELVKENIVILPLKYNKYYNNLINKIDSKNIFIGIETNQIINENLRKYIPKIENLVFPPILLNNNLYVSEELQESFNLLNGTNIKENYIIDFNTLLEKLELKENEENNKNIKKILNASFYSFKKIKEEFLNEDNINQEIKNDFELHTNLLFKEEEWEKIKNLSKEEINKKIEEQFKNVLYYVTYPSKRKKLKEKLPKWIVNHPLLKINIDLEEMKKNDPKKFNKYINKIKEELSILKYGNEVNKFKNNILFIYFIEILYFLRETNNIFLIRGSSSSFLINHLLGLSILDPLEYNLLTSRFLTGGRVMSGKIPDIDLDIPKSEVKKIIDKLTEKNIETGYPLVPVSFSEKKTILEIIRNYITLTKEDISELKLINDLIEKKEFSLWKSKLTNFLIRKNLNNDIIDKIFKNINNIIGNIENFVKHPSALIVSNNNILPIGEKKEGINIYYSTANFIEENGFGIKYDFLSSLNLEMVKYLENNFNIKFSKEEIEKSINEKDLLSKFINNINFEGIPQLDSEDNYFRFIKEKLFKLLKIKNINDLSNFLTLIRPGANIFEEEYILNSNILNEPSIENLKKKDIVKIQNKINNILKGKKLDNLIFNILKNLETETFDLQLKEFFNLKFKNKYQMENIKKIEEIYLILKKEIKNLNIETIYDLSNFVKLLDYKIDYNIRTFFKLNKNNKYNFLFDYILTKEDIENNNIEVKMLLKTVKEKIKEDKILKSLLNIEETNNINDIELLKKIKNIQNLYYSNKLLKNDIYNKYTNKIYKTNGTLIYQEQIMVLLLEGLNKKTIKDINQKYNINLDINTYIYDLLSNKNLPNNIKKELEEKYIYNTTFVDKIRKALGKKDVEILLKEEKNILNILEEIGFDNNTSIFIFEKMKESSEYMFNLSHSLTYSFFTSYFINLKINNPLAFIIAYKNIIKKDININNKEIIINKPTIFISKLNEYIIYENEIYEPLKNINEININILEKIDEIINKYKINSFEEFINIVNNKYIEITKKDIEILLKKGFFNIFINEKFLLDYIKKNNIKLEFIKKEDIENNLFIK